MGLGGISASSLLLILFIVILLFGTGKIRSMGKDLGAAVNSFRQGLNEESEQDQDKPNNG